MTDVLCGVSAFRYYRTPPQILDLYPRLPTLESDPRRVHLMQHPYVDEVLCKPLRLLVSSDSQRTGGRHIKQHLFASSEFKTCRNSLLGITATSPLATLFTMACHVSLTELVMAMYEFCGTFSVFKVPPRLEGHFVSVPTSWDDGFEKPWRRAGQGSNLWIRKPLIEINDLLEFANKMKGHHGANKFARAVACVNGITASPFEVELTMLLTLPRGLGGEGIKGFTNNQRIDMDPDAKKLAQKRTCYADLYHEGKGKGRPLILECQGEAFHDALRFGLADADRSLGLENMGYDVLELSHRQIRLDENYPILLREIYSRLGLRQRIKTEAQQRAECKLRDELFIDWADLGQ